MPIYEYECSACTQVSEVSHKMLEPSPTACPACGKGPLRKLISRTTFALKGSGYYTTDYKRAGQGAAPSESPAPACAAAGTPASCGKPECSSS